MLRPIFHLHFPKCGGTSLNTYLAQQFAAGDVSSAKDASINGGMSGEADELCLERIAKRLQSYRLITDHHLSYDLVHILAKYVPRPEVVTVLRKPRARLISLHQHLQRVPESLYASVGAEERELYAASRRLPFDGFLRFVRRNEVGSANFVNGLVRQLHATPNSDRSERRLDEAVQSLSEIDSVGVTERLDEFMLLLSLKKCWPPAGTQPRLNVGKPEEVEITSAAEEMIEEMTQLDEVVYIEAARRFDTEYRAEVAAKALSHWRNSWQSSESATTLRVSMDQSLPGIGWHTREGGIQGLARWIGPDPVGRLYVKLVPDHDYRARIFVVSVVSHEILETTRIEIEGEPFRLTCTPQNGYLVLEADIPSRCVSADGSVAIDIVSDRTDTVQRLHGVADDRPKTIAVECVEFEQRPAY